MRLFLKLHVPINTRLKRFLEAPTTALERAAENKRARVVRMLIEAGADYSLVVDAEANCFVAKIRAQITHEQVATIKRRVQPVANWGGFRRASL